MSYSAMRLGLLVGLVAAGAACRTAQDSCEDFIAAVEECQGGGDDYYNQAYCDDNVEAGCDDRRYYECLEDNLTCVAGQASTTPVICQVKSDVACPGE